MITAAVARYSQLMIYRDYDDFVKEDNLKLSFTRRRITEFGLGEFYFQAKV